MHLQKFGLGLQVAMRLKFWAAAEIVSKSWAREYCKVVVANGCLNCAASSVRPLLLMLVDSFVGSATLDGSDWAEIPASLSINEWAYKADVKLSIPTRLDQHQIFG